MKLTFTQLRHLDKLDVAAPCGLLDTPSLNRELCVSVVVLESLRGLRLVERDVKRATYTITDAGREARIQREEP